jgi:hypothetical protein
MKVVPLFRLLNAGNPESPGRVTTRRCGGVTCVSARPHIEALGLRSLDANARVIRAGEVAPVRRDCHWVGLCAEAASSARRRSLRCSVAQPTKPRANGGRGAIGP